MTCDSGEVLLLKYILNNTAADNVSLRLYVNDVVPAESDTLATYTQCSATGYAAITLTGSSWSFSTVAGTSSATYAKRTFTMSTAANVYGCYVTNAAGTALIWAMRFTDAPFVIGSTGGSIDVTPVISLD